MKVFRWVVKSQNIAVHCRIPGCCGRSAKFSATERAIDGNENRGFDLSAPTGPRYRIDSVSLEFVAEDKVYRLLNFIAPP